MGTEESSKRKMWPRSKLNLETVARSKLEKRHNIVAFASMYIVIIKPNQIQYALIAEVPISHLPQKKKKKKYTNVHFFGAFFGRTKV